MSKIPFIKQILPVVEVCHDRIPNAFNQKQYFMKEFISLPKNLKKDKNSLTTICKTEPININVFIKILEKIIFFIKGIKLFMEKMDNNNYKDLKTSRKNILSPQAVTATQYQRKHKKNMSKSLIFLKTNIFLKKHEFSPKFTKTIIHNNEKPIKRTIKPPTYMLKIYHLEPVINNNTRVVSPEILKINKKDIHLKKFLKK